MYNSAPSNVFQLLAHCYKKKTPPHPAYVLVGHALEHISVYTTKDIQPNVPFRPPRQEVRVNASWELFTLVFSTDQIAQDTF